MYVIQQRAAVLRLLSEVMIVTVLVSIFCGITNRGRCINIHYRYFGSIICIFSVNNNVLSKTYHWSSTVQNHIVTFHNDFQSQVAKGQLKDQPSASNMQEMVRFFIKIYLTMMTKKRLCSEVGRQVGWFCTKMCKNVPRRTVEKCEP